MIWVVSFVSAMMGLLKLAGALEVSWLVVYSPILALLCVTMLRFAFELAVKAYLDHRMKAMPKRVMEGFAKKKGSRVQF